MSIPVCAVTGRVAGDSDACGDCDPCLAAHTVPDAVKRLLAEKEEWRQRYGVAAAEADHYSRRADRAEGRVADLEDVLAAGPQF